MFKKTLLSIAVLSLAFVHSAQAYEISDKSGSTMSRTISVSSYSVSGTVKTVTDSQRDVRDYSDGILTIGEMNKHSVVEVHVNQGGGGVSVSGAYTAYAGLSHGNIEVGGSTSAGWEVGLSSAWDNSSIHETGTAVTDVNMYDFGGWPSHVGSTTETVYTNTWVNLANVDYTASAGSWSGSAVYIK